MLHFDAGVLASLSALPIAFAFRVSRYHEQRRSSPSRVFWSFPHPFGFLRYGAGQAVKYGAAFWLFDTMYTRLEQECASEDTSSVLNLHLLRQDTPRWAVAALAGGTAGATAEVGQLAFIVGRTTQRLRALNPGVPLVVRPELYSFSTSVAAHAGMWAVAMAVYEQMKEEWRARNDGASMPQGERWRLAAVAGGGARGGMFPFLHWAVVRMELNLAAMRAQMKGKEDSAKQDRKWKERGGAAGKRDAVGTAEGREQEKKDTKQSKKKKAKSYKKVMQEAFKESQRSTRPEPEVNPIVNIQPLTSQWWKLLARNAVRGALFFGTIIAVQDQLSDWLVGKPDVPPRRARARGEDGAGNDTNRSADDYFQRLAADSISGGKSDR